MFNGATSRTSFRADASTGVPVSAFNGVVVRGVHRRENMEVAMEGIIYLVGLVVVIMFVLSFLGLR